MQILILTVLIILGPASTEVRYREDFPNFVGPLAARPKPAKFVAHAPRHIQP